ncbi:DUF4870 domain-containing protein [Vallicoccus soli]|uniref:DUF4870 domain-containing protein n=2 Tax=Vallicoccus soli TaxID=2339232 RepID=A0A3A3Z8R9_9ACTN|nr:DUF4870 domain-containing protein [Vallicoccus soli]
MRPEDERTWGAVAHLSGVLAAWLALGFLGPLVVLAVQGGRSPFVRRHATEALNFQLTLLLLTVVASVLAIVTLGVGLLVVLPIGVVVLVYALVATVRATVRASSGRDYRYGLSWRIVR